jgi:glycosyltransferase involved in cell wall biosynthesis
MSKSQDNVQIPRVSIIVPVYNVEKYLRRCLDSIVTQTLCDIEIICVYNQSNDNSVSVLNEYAAKDERIKIIHNEKKGLSSARNEGMKHAAADNIGFVDSDDWIEPDTFELAYKAMIEYGVDLVCWYAQIELENRLSFDDIEMKGIRDYHKINNKGEVIITDDNFPSFPVTVWNKLYKRQIIEDYGIYFPLGLLHEDLEFFYKYIQLCKSVFFIDKCLTHYVQRPDSLMYKNRELSKQKKPLNKLLTDKLDIMRNIYQFSVKHNTIIKLKKTISRVLIWNCFISICNDNPGNLFCIFRYAAGIIKEMDLTLLEDSRKILCNLKNEKYFVLFFYFRMKQTVIYQITRKAYHKIKTLH